jgi:hypothetical protein
MKQHLSALAAAGLLAAGLALSANTASAGPLAGAGALQSAMPSNIETVQWRGGGGGWRGGGWGRPGWGYRGGCCWGRPGWGVGAVGAGIVAGAVVGAAIAGPPVVYAAPPPVVVYAPPPPGYYGAPPPQPYYAGIFLCCRCGASAGLTARPQRENATAKARCLRLNRLSDSPSHPGNVNQDRCPHGNYRSARGRGAEQKYP